MNELIAAAGAGIAILGLMLLAGLRLRSLVLALFPITLILVGILNYYLGIRSAPWIPYAYALFLTTVFIVRAGFPTVTAWPVFIVILLLYFLELFATSIGAGASLGQLLVGLKIYAPLWLFIVPLTALIAADADRFMTWAERAALALGVLQFPFVLSQFFYSSRHGQRFNADAIVGTFGGDPLRSGQNPTLLLFSLIAILVAIEMWQTSRLKTRIFAPLVAIYAINIMLGEVKAVFVLLPLALLAQQGWSGIRKNFAKVSLGLGLATLFLFGVGKLYEAFFWASDGRTEPLSYRIQRSFAYFFDPAGIDFQTGEVSRGASLMLWWQRDTDVIHRWLGYGIGSIRGDSTVANGIIGREFAPLDIASTTLAQLLWDGGIVAAAAFILALLMLYRQAARLATSAADRVEALRLRTVAAVAALALPFLVYNRYMVDAPAEQLLLVTLFAIVWQRYQASGDAASAVARHPLHIRAAGVRR